MNNSLKTKALSLFIFTVFLLAGCGGNRLSIKTDYNAIAFDKFTTYRWYEQPNTNANSKINAIVHQFIKDTIDQELAAKSLTKQTDSAVDFYVNFSVTNETRVKVKNYTVYSGTGPGFSWSRDTGFQSEIYTDQQTDYIYYREGTLMIDIIDPVSDKLIWRGVASKRLTKELTKQQREKLIKQAVVAVLINFPPKTNK